MSTHVLPAGESYRTAISHENVRLTITADSNSKGHVGGLPGNPGDGDKPSAWQTVGPDSTGLFTQSPKPSRWLIVCDQGALVIRSAP